MINETTRRPNYYVVELLPPESRAGVSDGTKVECTDVIHALGLDHDLGAAMKYLWRAGRKSDDIEGDLLKVITYVSFELKRVQAAKRTPSTFAADLAKLQEARAAATTTGLAPLASAVDALPSTLVPPAPETNATWLCDRCNEPKASKESYAVPNTFAPHLDTTTCKVCAKCNSELKKEANDVAERPEEKPVFGDG